MTQSRIASLTASLSVAVPEVTRADLGAERAHPQDVGPLALDVLGAHVHDARQVEQGAGGGGRDAVLAGAGLGDDPGLAEAAGQQRLAERVVDLVGAGVGQVLALEVEADGRDGRGRGAVAGEPAPASARDGRREAVGAVQRRRPAGEPRQQLAQVRPEHRIVAERVVRGLELVEGRHQRLGHVAATEVALHPPATGAVRLEQAGVDRRRPERDVRPVVAGGPGALHEQGDPERVLARPLPGDARRLDAGRDVDADRRDLAQRLGDVGRRSARRPG